MERNTHSILACKLAATGLSGVELNEVNLSLSEVAETPLDNFGLPSDIFVLYSLCSLYSRSEVVDLTSVGSTAKGGQKDQMYRVRLGRGIGW